MRAGVAVLLLGMVGVVLGVAAFLFLAGLGAGGAAWFVVLVLAAGAVTRWRHRRR